MNILQFIILQAIMLGAIKKMDELNAEARKEDEHAPVVITIHHDHPLSNIWKQANIEQFELRKYYEQR